MRGYTWEVKKRWPKREHESVNTGFSKPVWVMLHLGVGIVVPIVLIAAAIAVCAAQPEDSGYGGMEMAGLILACGFLYGWMLSGIACWELGRIWNRDQSTHAFRRHSLESFGLGYFLAGLSLLTVGIIVFIFRCSNGL